MEEIVRSRAAADGGETRKVGFDLSETGALDLAKVFFRVEVQPAG
ncbi:MAG: hypothetical protein P8M04_01885 [Akkermansiaceae bacterium]|jgi:hypothetical protein|nr:hypothetical protein [Akkermansiaceae bacterium]